MGGLAIYISFVIGVILYNGILTTSQIGYNYWSNYNCYWWHYR